MRILNVKKSIFFLVFAFFFFLAASSSWAQNDTFPLGASTIRTDNTVTVTINNTSGTLYQVRAALFVANSTQLAPKGNDYAYFSLSPNAQKSFTFSGLDSHLPYKAVALATTSTKSNPNPSEEKIYTKDFEVKATSSTYVPTQSSQDIPLSSTNTQNNNSSSVDYNATTSNNNSSSDNVSNKVPQGSNQCDDGIDNNGDGKADRYGAVIGGVSYEADPSCFSPSATTEVDDDVVSSIIPCTDKCTFSDVFRLLNNLLKFFITKLLIPLFVVMIIYAGYKYFKAGVSPGQKAGVKKMFLNMLGGLILILCAWLIVRTIMTTLLNDNFKESGIEFLGK